MWSEAPLTSYRSVAKLNKTCGTVQPRIHTHPIHDEKPHEDHTSILALCIVGKGEITWISIFLARMYLPYECWS